jgi:hypothetical protein
MPRAVIPLVSLYCNGTKRRSLDLTPSRATLRGAPAPFLCNLMQRGTPGLTSRPVPRISLSYDHRQVRPFARAYTLLHTAYKPVSGRWYFVVRGALSRSPARADVDFEAPVLFIWRAFGLPVK